MASWAGSRCGGCAFSGVVADTALSVVLLPERAKASGMLASSPEACIVSTIALNTLILVQGKLADDVLPLCLCCTYAE